MSLPSEQPRRSKRSADEEAHADAPGPKQTRYSSFPFFDLPREIRDQIFPLAFESEICKPYRPVHYIIYFPGFRLVAYASKDRSSDIAPWIPIGLPPWTVVNKRFLSEAIASFARHRVFEVQLRNLNFWSHSPHGADEQVSGYQTACLAPIHSHNQGSGYWGQHLGPGNCRHEVSRYS